MASAPHGYGTSVNGPSIFGTGGADDGGVAAQGVRLERGEHPVGHVRPHAEERFAFVGDVQRVDAEQLAGRARGGGPSLTPLRPG